MVKVTFKDSGYSWRAYDFMFDGTDEAQNLEDAQNFAYCAKKHFGSNGDVKNLIVEISYFEKLNTNEKEEN